MPQEQDDKDLETVLEVGQLWDHERTGNTFEILNVNMKVKAPGDANWHSAVSYSAVDDPSEEVYVRTQDDFRQKFAFIDIVCVY